nr:hypothetical protein [Tanacetum cinerariifolium]
SYSDNSSDLPKLVHSRAKIGERDSSTVPDTISDPEKNDLPRKQAELYREVHDKLGIEYLTSAHENHNQKIADWTPENLAKIVKEDLVSEEKEKLDVLSGITSKEEELVSKVSNASGIHVYGVNNNNTEVGETKVYYAERHKENEEDYDMCKAELLISS